MCPKPMTNDTRERVADTPDPMIVSLDGDLDLRRADRVRADLLQAIDSGDPVRIELRDATGADVAFVQVLLAAVRAAARRGRPLDIAGLDGGPFPTLFAALGLIRSGEDIERFLIDYTRDEASA